MFIKPKFDGNMKNMRVDALINYVNGISGAYVECDADTLGAVRRLPDRIHAARRALSSNSQLSAIRAPVNRSQLRGMDFMVLHAIGRNAWNRAISAPVNLDIYPDERAYLAEAWRNAMHQMQAFYRQAVKFKEVQF